jgi:DNA (cytosine-5)-methyltransferase 1
MYALLDLDRHYRRTAANQDYVVIDLHAFAVYQPQDSKRPQQLVSLDRLTFDGHPKFCFDGYLAVGETRHWVQGVPFAIITIDGYGDRDATALVNDQIYIQSILASKYGKSHDIYYRLRQPAPEYSRFYTPFVWLVTFTKHFIDFLTYREAGVGLGDFGQGFSTWLERTYSTEELRTWRSQYHGQDFRQHVIAHVDFLWKECYGLSHNGHNLLSHPLWSLVGPRDLDAIPAQPLVEKGTVVTPFAFQCFSSFYFSKVLKTHYVYNHDLAERVETRKRKLGLTLGTFQIDPRKDLGHLPIPLLEGARSITQGDVVAIQPETDGSWRSAAPVWYAYVQDIHAEEERFDVLWLYSSSDTTLGDARYPFPNELFMSDNCGCDRSQRKDSIPLDQVLGKAHVEWFPKHPSATPGLFIRRLYRTQTHDFVMLKREAPYRCECGRQTRPERYQSEYAVGDTVLFGSPCSARLQCAQIIRFDDQHVLIRRFVRAAERKTKARPNEVVPEDVISRCPISQIERKCQIRTFQDGIVASPYDRDGAGDLFYVLGNSTSTALPLWKEGWDPMAPRTYPPLTGLGLFVGGGGLDRGLEDGGAVAFSHAVEWGPNALHSYHANARHAVECFLGSVNDYMARALRGEKSPLIAMPGEIDVIAAGSPCQGFSRMQNHPLSMDNIRNASMVASLIAFADLYAPEYLILENVLGMCSSTGIAKGLLQQIMAGLVGLGYQVQTFLGDAWSCGSSQRRPRVFIVASAPGLNPFDPLPRTHAYANANGVSAQALGKLSNGLSFGDRLTGPTPFEAFTAGQAVADLPFIGDGIVHICPEFPDHRLPVISNAINRRRMAAVPRFPRGVGLRYAYAQGLLSGEPLAFCESGNELRRGKTSKTYCRIDPNDIFPTILTTFSAHDAIAGRILHWDQDRTLTVQEARRAQGWPDEEVLIGPPSKQLHIVGNSVDRRVSLALGRCLYTSWTTSAVRGGEKVVPLEI